MGKSHRLPVELVYRASPPGQPVILRVEDTQVVDVPQQMGPAALVGTVVVVIGSVEVADQHAGKLLAQDLIHHGLATSPAQEVSLGGSAEGPHVAVVSAFPPAGLIGVDHRAAPDAFHNARQFPLCLGGHFARGVHQGAQAEVQPVHRLQVPLYGAPGQPGLLPEGGNQADQVDPQALLSRHHALQLRRRHMTALAEGADPGDIDVFGYLHRNPGQVDHLPRALDPAAGQPAPAVRTLLQHMLHPMGGFHTGPGETVAAGLAWFLARFIGLLRVPVRFGFQTRHPARDFGCRLPFQLGNPFLQGLDDCLLPDDDANQDIPIRGGQVNFSFRSLNMT